MVGYIQEAIAQAIRDWPELRAVNAVPVRATDGSSIVVNTPLPAIIINVVGNDGEGNTFIGGVIRQYFDLELWVLLDVPNYTFSKDAGLQAKNLDISDDVIRCVEHPDFLADVKAAHDLNMQFDRMETETTYGTKNALSVTIDIHKVIYNCSVAFNKKDEAYNRYADLERIEVDNNEINQIIIE